MSARVIARGCRPPSPADPVSSHGASAMTCPMRPRPDDFDARSEETFDSPHELYRRLRAEQPLAYSNEYGGFWALTRFADDVDAARNSDPNLASVSAVVPGDPHAIRRTR